MNILLLGLTKIGVYFVKIVLDWMNSYKIFFETDDYLSVASTTIFFSFSVEFFYVLRFFFALCFLYVFSLN